MTILENATFACVENEAYLVALRLPGPPKAPALPPSGPSARPSKNPNKAPSKGLSKGPIEPLHEGLDGVQDRVREGDRDVISGGASEEVSLVDWMVGYIGRGLDEDSAAAGPRRECLHAALSVLMNVTHNNVPGCAAVMTAGGVRAVAGLLDRLLGPATPPADGCDGGGGWADVGGCAGGGLSTVPESPCVGAGATAAGDCAGGANSPGAELAEDVRTPAGGPPLSTSAGVGSGSAQRRARDRASVLRGLDVISVSMGVLINLVEREGPPRSELVELPLGGVPGGVLAILCRLIMVWLAFLLQ